MKIHHITPTYYPATLIRRAFLIRHEQMAQDQVHTFFCLSQNWRALFIDSSGFSDVECFEDEPIPHGLKSGVRWFPWKGIRGMAAPLPGRRDG